MACLISLSSLALEPGAEIFVSFQPDVLSDRPIPFSKCGFAKDEGMGGNGTADAEERSRQAALESFQRTLRDGP